MRAKNSNSNIHLKKESGKKFESPPISGLLIQEQTQNTLKHELKLQLLILKNIQEEEISAQELR